MISPLALEAVRRIDALFEIERGINGETPQRRRAARQELSATVVADLQTWMREQRAKLSRRNDVAKAMHIRPTGSTNSRPGIGATGTSKPIRPPE